MTDRDIPKQCRTCELCKRYIEIPEYLPLYDWQSWKYKCQFKHELWKYDICPNYKEKSNITNCWGDTPKI